MTHELNQPDQPVCHIIVYHEEGGITAGKSVVPVIDIEKEDGTTKVKVLKSPLNDNLKKLLEEHHKKHQDNGE